MKDRRSGFYKIGRSVNPCYREKILQAEIPLVEIIEAWWSTNDHETKVHRMLKEFRLRGEWFKLRPEHLEVISEYFASNERLIAGGILKDEIERADAEAEDATEARTENDNLHSAWFVEELGYNAAAVDFAVEGFGLEL